MQSKTIRFLLGCDVM